VYKNKLVEKEEKAVWEIVDKVDNSVYNSFL